MGMRPEDYVSNPIPVEDVEDQHAETEGMQPAAPDDQHGQVKQMTSVQLAAPDDHGDHFFVIFVCSNCKTLQAHSG
jgi:hypothetical protein